MTKGLEALAKITGTQNLTMYEQNECLKTIEKELKALAIIKKHLRIVKPFDLETKEEEPYEIFDIDLWNKGKQKEDFEFVKEVLL